MAFTGKLYQPSTLNRESLKEIFCIKGIISLKMKDLVVQHVVFYEGNKLWKMGFAAEKNFILDSPGGSAAKRYVV